MAEENTLIPDTVVKFFEECKNKEEISSELAKSLDKTTNNTGCLTLQLRESLQGNILNKPYQFILIRNIHEKEKEHYQNFDKANYAVRDYFITLEKRDYLVTLEKAKCQSKYNFKSWQVNEKFVSTLDVEVKRYVILAYKTLDENFNSNFEKNWKDWTGAKQLVQGLATRYKILNVWYLKGLSAVPGIFRYIVVIELCMNKERKQTDNYALDCLQKFRIRRMSGYVALYVPIHY